MNKKVLITGMSGLIGGLIGKRLMDKGGYDISSLNRRPVADVKNFQADISDLEAIKPAFVDKDIVVHMAAHSGEAAFEELLKSNVIGTYNVFEASRLAGVKRIIFASTGSVIRGFELVSPYDKVASGTYDGPPQSWQMVTHEMFRPSGIYGASKMWGEALARHYSDAYGLSIICVRIGGVPKDNTPRQPRQFSIYLSHSDVTQIIERCIEAPDHVKFDTFLATSNNKWNYRDLDHARDILGFIPEDTADNFPR